MRQIGQDLVAPDIERAKQDRARLRLIEDTLVVFGEVFDVREVSRTISGNSVRNSPTPSAPVVASCARSSSRPAFSISLIATPSRVTAGAERKVS